jgi:hypothetical protein
MGLESVKGFVIAQVRMKVFLYAAYGGGGDSF